VDIRHVVVLMLENRSFDCMLGNLYPSGPGYDGLTGTERNIWHRPDGSQQVIEVWQDPALTARTGLHPRSRSRRAVRRYPHANPRIA
jgi:phospholipase C